MLYEKKIDWNPAIDWSDPHPPSYPSQYFVHDVFKRAVLDYQIQVEGELEDIINRHFRNPSAFKVKYAPFKIQIAMVRALIGETPDLSTESQSQTGSK